MIRTLIGILACMTLAGCGAQGEAYQPSATPASQSVIYVYRPYGLLSSQTNPMITCGRDSIELETSGFYELVADSGPVTCVAATDTTAELKFDAHAGEQYFIKEDVDSSGHVRFKLMDADVGRDQIKECSRQGIKQ
jgi:nucleoid-associated protein YgaU